VTAQFAKNGAGRTEFVNVVIVNVISYLSPAFRFN
jgi:hypothetical protein